MGGVVGLAAWYCRTVYGIEYALLIGGGGGGGSLLCALDSTWTIVIQTRVSPQVSQAMVHKVSLRSLVTMFSLQAPTLLSKLCAQELRVLLKRFSQQALTMALALALSLALASTNNWPWLWFWPWPMPGTCLTLT